MSSGPAPAPSQTFPVSATTSHGFGLKAAARQFPSSGEVIPIEIDPHLLPRVHNFNKKTPNYPDSYRDSTGELKNVSSKIKQEAAPTYVPEQHQKKLRTQETMNDRFTAYISRVKHGLLRTFSNVVGGSETSSGNEDCDDKLWIKDNSISHMKINNSSSVVGGKNVTFK